MSIISLSLLLIVIIYGGMTILSCAIQMNQNKSCNLSLLIMLAGAFLIIISVMSKNIFARNLIFLLVAGLVLIHSAAINNGLKMYGKIHFKHHFIRLVLSIIITCLYLLG